MLWYNYPKEKLFLNDVSWNESIQIPEEHSALVLERVEKGVIHPEILLCCHEDLKTSNHRVRKLEVKVDSHAVLDKEKRNLNWNLTPNITFLR